MQRNLKIKKYFFFLNHKKVKSQKKASDTSLPKQTSITVEPHFQQGIYEKKSLSKTIFFVGYKRIIIIIENELLLKGLKITSV